METITLKNSDLTVSRFCIGGCPMGGYGWGDVHEQELIDAVHAALDSGVTFFDTAETYGLGQSERTLGKALGARRKDVVISDKFGVHAKKGQPTFYDNSREYIFEACEGSLQRLGTDYIDLYTVHYRDGKTPLADVAETLERLREQGKIRYAALSNIGEADEAERTQSDDRSGRRAAAVLRIQRMRADVPDDGCIRLPPHARFDPSAVFRAHNALLPRRTRPRL